MINVNELMLYSVIDTPIGIRKVTGLNILSADSSIIHVDNGTEHDAKLCNGIPLIPEWLERCGFVKEKDESKDSYSTYAILKMGGGLAKTEDGWYLQITDVDGYYEQLIGRKIEHLHQLQRLYFDLTGEELKIEL